MGTNRDPTFCEDSIMLNVRSDEQMVQTQADILAHHILFALLEIQRYGCY